MVKLSKSIFFFVTLIVALKLSAQDTVRYANFKQLTNDIFQSISTKYPNVSFLKYKKTSSNNIYEEHKGLEIEEPLNILSYLSLVNDLDISNFNEHPKINLRYLENKMIESINNYFVPISLSFVEYHDFTDLALYHNYIQFSNNKIQDLSPQGFQTLQKKHLFASSVLNQVFKNSEITFLFDESLFLTNLSTSNFSSMMIDFGDGSGYKPLYFGQNYSISYATTGQKTIKTKLVMNNQTYYSSSTIIIEPNVENLGGSNSTNSCSSTIIPPDSGPIAISTSKLGELVSGKYAIWYSHCNKEHEIRKPYIISAGFNPGNGKQLTPFSFSPNDLTFSLNGTTITLPVTIGWRGTYYETYNGGYNKSFSPIEVNQCGEGSSNGNNYLERLRDEGYDIIILMYDNGTDFAIHNAALLMELIEKINIEKFSKGHYFENVVSGYSAGGIASKLALALMESRYKRDLGPNPHTRMWVGIEAENQGTNMPLGFQNLIQFQADPGKILPVVGTGLNILQHEADVINQLSAFIASNFNFNPGANELMRYNILAGNNSHQYRIDLEAVLNSIPYNTSHGYPEFCRRVGVSQGSATGVQNMHTYPELFDSKLKFNLLGDSYQYTTCDGTYTAYRPVTEKRTTARWWGSINSNSNIFDGFVSQDKRWTLTERVCMLTNIPYFGYQCICFPSIEIGGAYILIGEQHKPKPDNVTNYDDVPASNLDGHLQLYNVSAYKFYNNWFAGNAFATKDPKLQPFSPTISTLDIRDPSTNIPVNNFTSVASLNLMKINPTTPHNESRFGFPFLSYPLNHYNVTPFDAIYAIGTNNGTYSDGTTPKPNNQYHVEDPQSLIGDYLARIEVAPENLFLSNRTIGLGMYTTLGYYPAEFEARSKIIIGKNEDSGQNSIYSKYGNQYYLTPDGDFSVQTNAKLILHSGEQVELLPGFSATLGSELKVNIQEFDCNNDLFKTRRSSENSSTEIQNEEYNNHIKGKQNDGNIEPKIYPNPNTGIFTIVFEESINGSVQIFNLTGTLVYSSILHDEARECEINLLGNRSGLYFVKIISDKGNYTTKVIIN